MRTLFEAADGGFKPDDEHLIGGDDDSEIDDDEEDRTELVRQRLEEYLADIRNSSVVQSPYYTNDSGDGQGEMMPDDYSDDDESYAPSDDEDECDIDDEDWEADDEERNEDTGPVKSPNKEKKTRNRRRIKPGHGSCLYNKLKSVCKKVKENDASLGLSKGTCWIAPTNPNCRSLGGIAEPDDYHMTNHWIYIFDPMKQCRHLMPPDGKFACIHCDSRDTIYKRFDWRPAHMIGSTVHVVHRRVRCKSCKKEFATIHPKALASINNRISSSFPFVFPRTAGPGLHVMTLMLHVCLIPKGIQAGAFSSAINSLQRIQYAISHESYLDAVLAWMKQPPVYVQSRIPTPYGAYRDHDGHLAIELLPGTLNSGMGHFMENYEPYMQNAFQLASGKGADADDSHKLCKYIGLRVDKNFVNPFTAIYSVLSDKGLVNLSRPRFTKDSSELDETLKGWQQVRTNAGQPKISVVTRDNAAAEKSVFNGHFPEMLEGIEPYVEPGSGRAFTIRDEDYVLITNWSALDRIATVISSSMSQIRSKTGTGIVRIVVKGSYDSLVGHPSGLEVGTAVAVKVGLNKVARGTLVSIGHRGGAGGESTFWGRHLVGSGMALVKVDRVVIPSIKLPLQKQQGECRTFGDLDLRDDDSRIIAVKTSGILVGGQLEEKSLEASLGLRPQQRRDTSGLSSAGSDNASSQVTSSQDSSQTSLPSPNQASTQDQPGNDDRPVVKTREKSDSWHKL